jgi:hypothetical protein
MITASTVETEIFTALNGLRTDPNVYAAEIDSRLEDFTDEFYHTSGDKVTKDDLITVQRIARAQEPLSGLTWNDGLALAAKDHCRDIGLKGEVSGIGTDGSTYESRLERYGQHGDMDSQTIVYQRPSAKEIMLQLLFEEVPHPYGHANVWNGYFTYAGVGACWHSTLGNMVVILYADDFTLNDEARRRVEAWGPPPAITERDYPML